MYSPSFGLNPKKAVNVEYNIPNECGNFVASNVSQLFPFPCANTVVSHSPTPSILNIAASLYGEVKYEYPICESWCDVNLIWAFENIHFVFFIKLKYCLIPFIPNLNASLIWKFFRQVVTTLCVLTKGFS